MDNPYFSIKVISDIVGIAPETIRHYERKNILKPSIEDSNGYRRYKMSDVCILGKARAYRQYGFSLNEIQRMVTEPNPDYAIEKMHGWAAEMEQKIFEEIAMLNAMKKKIEQVRSQHRKFSIQNRPEMLAIRTFTKGAPDLASIHAAKASAWYSNQIVTFPCWSFQGEQFKRRAWEDYSIYMAMMRSDLAKSEIILDDNILQLPACTCLYTSTISSVDEDRETTLAPILDYINAQGMNITGEVIWQTVYGHATENSFMYYRNCWIPIL